MIRAVSGQLAFRKWRSTKHVGAVWTCGVEASGAPGVIEAATATLARHGTALLLGLGPHHVQLDPVRVIRMGTRIQGSMGHSGAGAFGGVIRLMGTGRLDMTQIVTTRVALDQAVNCLEQLRDREAGKCMVVFDA